MTKVTETAPAIDAASISELVASIANLTLAIRDQMAANSSPPATAPVSAPALAAPSLATATDSTLAHGSGMAGSTQTFDDARTSTGTLPNDVAADLVRQDDPTDISWYTVTRGRRRVGVFCHWDEISPLVIRVSTACFKKYPSRGEALAAYQRAWDRGDVQILP